MAAASSLALVSRLCLAMCLHARNRRSGGFAGSVLPVVKSPPAGGCGPFYNSRDVLANEGRCREIHFFMWPVPSGREQFLDRSGLEGGTSLGSGASRYRRVCRRVQVPAGKSIPGFGAGTASPSRLAACRWLRAAVRRSVLLGIPQDDDPNDRDDPNGDHRRGEFGGHLPTPAVVREPLSTPSGFPRAFGYSMVSPSLHHRSAAREHTASITPPPPRNRLGLPRCRCSAGGSPK